MTLDDFTRQRITVAIDDCEIASMRIGHGWICEVIDVGLIPFEVAALIKFLEKRYGKPVEEA